MVIIFLPILPYYRYFCGYGGFFMLLNIYASNLGSFVYSKLKKEFKGQINNKPNYKLLTHKMIN